MAPGIPHFRIGPAALGTAAALLALAGTLQNASAQLSGPAPRIRQIVAPIATANRVLEEALQQELFPVSVLDDQGHGPDPGTAEWRQAEIHQRRNACRAAGPLRYAYNRIDLNGDRQDELVATVIGPYTCGTGGCNAYVFQSGPKGKGLRLVSQMSLFKPPLVVSDQRHNGWRDLISRVRIDAGHGYYARLPFNGRGYPSNPSTPPAEPLRSALPGVAMLNTDDDASPTHPLPCDRPAIAAPPRGL
ncbi:MULTISPECIES: hypothetical protein [unclassified Synechococcus]|uniref:hypothetical protein n=1 Tax=unclassified Synechococcus TaxID=2626047 RepID=UPI00006996D0|nr:MULTISPECIES: hypothetical protein [unclassified Synechococcus]EAQ75090.1 hypothetical protein WH5701_08409 [Synechococcus sp. WH 5701]WFN60373.1 hypothetical protein N4320_07435 [Synechococcus sp. CCFWC 502]